MTVIPLSNARLAIRRLTLTSCAMLVAILLAFPSWAINCHTNCKKKCSVSVFCLGACEAEKKKECAKDALNAKLPVPLPNTGPIIVGPGDIANPAQLREEVEQQYNSACAFAFRSVTKPVKLGCSVKAKKFERDELDDAVDILVAIGLYERSEFERVDIRWCPLALGDGIAHEPELVLLSDQLKGAWLPNIAAQLGHEMVHVRQWREHGAAFPCKYSEAMAACVCGTDPKNRFEKPAYAMYHRVMGMFLEPAQSCGLPDGTKCGLRASTNLGMACACGDKAGRGTR